MRGALAFVSGALSVAAGIGAYHLAFGRGETPPAPVRETEAAPESAATLGKPPEDGRLDRLEIEVAALRRAVDHPAVDVIVGGPEITASKVSPNTMRVVNASAFIPSALAATEAEEKSFADLSTERLINDARVLATSRSNPEGVAALWKVILRRATSSEARLEALMQLGHAGRFLKAPAGLDLCEKAYREAAMVAGPATDGAREAQTNLAEVLLWKKDGQGARDFADALLADEGLSRLARPRVRFTHAQSLEALGYTADARAEYEALAKEFPEGDNNGWVGKAAKERLKALN